MLQNHVEKWLHAFVRAGNRPRRVLSRHLRQVVDRPTLFGAGVENRVFHLLVRRSERRKQVEEVGFDLRGARSRSVGFVEDDERSRNF
jgi:hypothetical protein